MYRIIKRIFENKKLPLNETLKREKKSRAGLSDQFEMGQCNSAFYSAP